MQNHRTIIKYLSSVLSNIKVALIVVFTTFLIFPSLFAQDWLDPEVEPLIEQGLAFQAYEQLTRSANAANIFDEDRLIWRNKAVQLLHDQLQQTDSSYLALKKITDLFYFYEGRIAKGWIMGSRNELKAGFFDKNGEAVFEETYQETTAFDHTTGYTIAAKDRNLFWLGADGKTYSIEKSVDKLPKVTNLPALIVFKKEEKIPLKSLLEQRDTSNMAVFTTGVRLFDASNYLDAYMEFDRLLKSKDNLKLKLWCLELQDSCAVSLNNQLELKRKELKRVERLMFQYEFFDDQIALAYQDNKFFYINRAGEELKNLGRWDKAYNFENNLYAKVWKNGHAYLIDTLGSAISVAYDIKELRKSTKALVIKNQDLSGSIKKVVKYKQLEVLIINGGYAFPESLSIPNSISQLKNLQQLRLTNHKVKNIPTGIKELGKLKILDVGGNALTKLPSEIGALNELEYLDVSMNKIREFPQTISQLIKLKRLRFEQNIVSNLPAELGNLKSLERIDANRNPLTSLPESIGQLSSLVTLDFSSNKLTGFPLMLTKLKNLISLNLAFNNSIGIFPAELGQLNQLENLNLSGTGIKSIPPEIGQMKGLRYLRINSNKLQALPEEIGELSELQLFRVYYNQLRKLPKSLGKLQKLRVLTLSYNPLNTLAPQVFELKKLNGLFVRNIGLKKLPPEIGKLTRLTEIDFQDNQLSKLPDEFSKLKALEVLDLSKNKFLEFPSALETLDHLQDLRINANDISLFNNDLSKLQNLMHFDVSHNKIKVLPKSIGLLESLQVLNASHNMMISFYAEAFSKSYNLRDLNLSDNRIITLPSGTENMTKLQVLDLRRNELIGIHVSIANLKSLERLYLEQNKIYDIPDEVLELSKLKSLYINGNGVKKFPQNISKLGALISLGLSGNYMDIDEINRIITALPRLERLKIGSMSLTSIPKSLYEAKRIQYLDFSNYYSEKHYPNKITMEEQKQLKKQFPNIYILF